MSHFWKTFEDHIAANALSFAESCRVERVEHSDAVNAIRSVVGASNVYIALTYITDLDGALVRLRQQVVCLNEVLVVLGNQRMVLTVAACDLDLSLQENFLRLLLILLDKLGFSLLRDSFSPDVVELIFSSQDSLNWLSSFKG